MSTTPAKSTILRSTMRAVSGAKKAVSEARRELEGVERTLHDLMAGESSEPEVPSAGGGPPSANKRSVPSVGIDDKENCPSSSKQLKPSTVANLLFDFEKTSEAATPDREMQSGPYFDFGEPSGASAPNTAKSLDSRNLASEVGCFTRAIKVMNANGGRTPTKDRKNGHGKGSGDSRNLASEVGGFTRSIKEMNANGGRTPTKDRKNDHGKGSGVKPPVDGPPEKAKVGRETNTDEDILFEVKAKPYCTCLSGTEQDAPDGLARVWIKSDAGDLRLYRHRATGKTRLVQRNRIGTVKLNVAIAGGMFCLEKVRVKVRGEVLRKPREVDLVQFIAVADKERGVEFFRLKVNPGKVDVLYEKLKEMGAEIKVGTGV